MKSRQSALIYLKHGIDLSLLNGTLFLFNWLNQQFLFGDHHIIEILLIHSNISWGLSNLIVSRRKQLLPYNLATFGWQITKLCTLFAFVGFGVAFYFFPKYVSIPYLFQFSFLLYVVKFIFDWYILLPFENKYNKDHSLQTAIVGYNDTGLLLQHYIESNPEMGFSFCGFIGEGFRTDILLGTPDELDHLIQRHNIQMIMYVNPFQDENENEKEFNRIFEICNKKGVNLRLITSSHLGVIQSDLNENIGSLLLFKPRKDVQLGYRSVF